MNFKVETVILENCATSQTLLVFLLNVLSSWSFKLRLTNYQYRLLAGLVIGFGLDSGKDH